MCRSGKRLTEKKLRNFRFVLLYSVCYNHPQQVNSNQKREADQNAELQKGQLHGGLCHP